MTAIVELTIAGPVEPWQRIGLVVVDGSAQVGGVRLRFIPGDGGVVAWGLVDLPAPCDRIDGLATHVVEDRPVSAPHSGGTLGATGFDHVVVMTSSLDRTCGEIERITGEPLKRVREAGAIRQGFHRLGEVIVEVVESSQVTTVEAAFWGFVWNVADIHEVCASLGPEVIGLPRPAVQSGRFIATFRGSLGLGVQLAIMSPPVERESRS